MLHKVSEQPNVQYRSFECDLNLVWCNRTEQSKLQWPRTQSEFLCFNIQWPVITYGFGFRHTKAYARTSRIRNVRFQPAVFKGVCRFLDVNSVYTCCGSDLCKQPAAGSPCNSFQMSSLLGLPGSGTRNPKLLTQLLSYSPKEAPRAPLYIPPRRSLKGALSRNPGTSLGMEGLRPGCFLLLHLTSGFRVRGPRARGPGLETGFGGVVFRVQSIGA